MLSGNEGNFRALTAPAKSEVRRARFALPDRAPLQNLWLTESGCDDLWQEL